MTSEDGDPRFWFDQSLVATNAELTEQEARWYWNMKPGADRLVTVLEGADHVPLGRVYVLQPRGLDDGPAKRIGDLIFLRGTTPDDFDGYVLPFLDDRLIDEINAAYGPRPGDRTVPASAPDDLDQFLRQHRNWRVVTMETANLRRPVWRRPDPSGQS